MSYRTIRPEIALFCAGMLLLAPFSHAQRRGRKYKAPPPTSQISVAVVRNDNGKPIPNAAVVFHPTKDGKDEGNLEVKTNEDGVASIDVIPTGSNVQVQVIASGFATYANEYFVAESKRDIQVKMLEPRAQLSSYQDNAGKPADTPAGVQTPDYLKHQSKPAPATESSQPGTPK